MDDQVHGDGKQIEIIRDKPERKYRFSLLTRLSHAVITSRYCVRKRTDELDKGSSVRRCSSGWRKGPGGLAQNSQEGKVNELSKRQKGGVSAEQG